MTRGLAQPFAPKKSEVAARPCPCVLLQGQGWGSDSEHSRTNRRDRIPASSQKRDKGRRPSRIRSRKGWASTCAPFPTGSFKYQDRRVYFEHSQNEPAILDVPTIQLQNDFEFCCKLPGVDLRQRQPQRRVSQIHAYSNPKEQDENPRHHISRRFVEPACPHSCLYSYSCPSAPAPSSLNGNTISFANLRYSNIVAWLQ
jgi:hypothetical protein